MSEKTEKQNQAIEYLRDSVKPGDTVYTVLRHVSPSGMTRWIDLYVIRDNKPRRISYNVGTAGIESYDRKREAVKVGGCGMDMGFHLVYWLGEVLFGDGYALKHSWM